MIQKSKIRKSWYASSRMIKDEWYQQAVKKNQERLENTNYSTKMIFDCTLKAKEHQKAVKSEIEELLKQHYKTAYNAAHFSGFKLMTGKIGVRTDYNLDWDMYSKSYGHPGKEFYTCIKIPVLFDLPPENLRIFDDIVNLKCDFLKRENSISFYNALWIKQGKGFNIEIASGIIAVNWKLNISFHAETLEDAESGLIKKIKKETAPPKKEKVYSEWKPTDYITRKKFHQLTGACMEGIEQFCHRARIDDKKRRMQIKDLLPLLEKHAKTYYDKITEYAPQLLID